MAVPGVEGGWQARRGDRRCCRHGRLAVRDPELGPAGPWGEPHPGWGIHEANFMVNFMVNLMVITVITIVNLRNCHSLLMVHSGEINGYSHVITTCWLIVINSEVTTLER